MSELAQKPPPSVPRWLVRTIWMLHRTAYSVTRGRFGLRTPTRSQWGMLRLTTVGRRTGRKRLAILGYLEDGPNLAIPAMNGWADPEPAWWLNLQSQPEAIVELPGGRRQVTARAAEPDERRRLWARFVGLGTLAYTDASAALRSRETAIVVLEPRAHDPGDAVEAGVEAEDPADVLRLHHGDVDGVAGEPLVLVDMVYESMSSFRTI